MLPEFSHSAETALAANARGIVSAGATLLDLLSSLLSHQGIIKAFQQCLTPWILAAVNQDLSQKERGKSSQILKQANSGK